MSGQDLSDVLIGHCSQADIDVASQLYRCANVMGPIVCLSVCRVGVWWCIYCTNVYVLVGYVPQTIVVTTLKTVYT